VAQGKVGAEVSNELKWRLSRALSEYSPRRGKEHCCEQAYGPSDGQRQNNSGAHLPVHCAMALVGFGRAF